jgi:hypothetical protein
MLHGFDDLDSCLAVRLDQLKLLRGQGTRFLDHRIGDPDHADVVKQAGPADRFDLIVVQPQRLGQRGRLKSDGTAVSTEMLASCIDGIDERRERSQRDLSDRSRVPI